MLIEHAEHTDEPAEMLDLEDADILLTGNIPARINEQRKRLGYKRLVKAASTAPQHASIIFHRLARQYA